MSVHAYICTYAYVHTCAYIYACPAVILSCCSRQTEAPLSRPPPFEVLHLHAYDPKPHKLLKICNLQIRYDFCSRASLHGWARFVLPAPASPLELKAYEGCGGEGDRQALEVSERVVLEPLCFSLFHRKQQQTVSFLVQYWMMKCIQSLLSQCRRALSGRAFDRALRSSARRVTVIMNCV